MSAETPTQRERVLAILWETDEVCGSRFFEAYIPRFSVWIHRLREAGYIITKRPCDREAHDHRGTAWLYRLEATPQQAAKLGQLQFENE